ncbi:MAG: dihydropteroate synthase [Nocardioides sp.]
MHAAPPRTLDGLPRPPRALVMAVVNVTQDSFSDGGRFLDQDRAVAHGLRLVEEGADLVDVGGESTRPGAERVPLDEELRRVLPVVSRLSAAGVTVSVDTMRAEVAEASVEMGAVLVNDVSGGRADPAMFATVARLGVGYVLMHWRSHSAQMTAHADYDDVVLEVADELRVQRDAAVAAGIRPGRIALDPGIGFSKTADQNWQVLAGLEVLHDLGHPLLVATSRKRFLGHLLAEGKSGAGGDLRDSAEREDATVATTTLAAVAGAWCIRAHAARATADAVRVAARWAAAHQEADDA